MSPATCDMTCEFNHSTHDSHSRQNDPTKNVCYKWIIANANALTDVSNNDCAHESLECFWL